MTFLLILLRIGTGDGTIHNIEFIGFPKDQWGKLEYEFNKRLWAQTDPVGVVYSFDPRIVRNGFGETSPFIRISTSPDEREKTETIIRFFRGYAIELVELARFIPGKK